MFFSPRTRRAFPIVRSTMFIAALAMAACRENPASLPKSGASSKVTISLNKGGPLVVNTPMSEFDIFPSGYVEAWLLKDGKKITLDEPGSAALGDRIVVAGKTVEDFIFDFNQVKSS